MLHIHLFGAFELSTSEGSPVVFGTRTARELLALLLLEPNRGIGKEALADRLWEGGGCPKNPGKALNTEIWRLRRCLEGSAFAGHLRIATGESRVAAGVDDAVAVDMVGFQAALEAIEHPPEHPPAAGPPLAAMTRAGEQLTRIYRGELLSDIPADWCLMMRESARAAYIAAMERLLECEVQAGQWREVVRHALAILRVEPLLEHVFRHLLRGLAGLGDRAAAQRHFAAFERRVQDDLGCQPMPETVALARTIITGPLPPAPPAPPSLVPSPFGPPEIAINYGSLAQQIERAAASLGRIAFALRACADEQKKS